MNTTLCTVLIVAVLIALRMLFINPAWTLLPKRWQIWLHGKSYSPFKTKSN